MPQTIHVHGKSFVVNAKGYEHFWKEVNGTNWEPETFKIFNENIDSGTFLIDIGAWIGPTVLYASQLAGKAIAFEPDPVAFPRLKENLALNTDAAWHDNVTLFDKAVSTRSGKMSLGSQNEGGDSMSSVLFADAATSWMVEATTLEDVMENQSVPGQKIFLKIDIEGGEYDLIPQIKDVLANRDVTAYISLHPHFLRRSLKKSVGKICGIPNFIKTRLQYLAIYRRLIGALPHDRKIEINGKEYTSFKWFLLHAFLRLRTPSDLLITNR